MGDPVVTVSDVFLESMFEMNVAKTRGKSLNCSCCFCRSSIRANYVLKAFLRGAVWLGQLARPS